MNIRRRGFPGTALFCEIRKELLRLSHLRACHNKMCSNRSNNNPRCIIHRTTGHQKLTGDPSRRVVSRYSSPRPRQLCANSCIVVTEQYLLNVVTSNISTLQQDLPTRPATHREGNWQHHFVENPKEGVHSARDIMETLRQSFLLLMQEEVTP